MESAEPEADERPVAGVRDDDGRDFGWLAPDGWWWHHPPFGPAYRTETRWPVRDGAGSPALPGRPRQRVSLDGGPVAGDEPDDAVELDDDEEDDLDVDGGVWARVRAALWRSWPGRLAHSIWYGDG